MIRFEPVRKLEVKRCTSTGVNVPVGTLAQNRQGVFFAYDAQYLSRYGNLSPIRLQADTRLQPAPSGPHDGLHGVFSDSLPDGWGRLLQDRHFLRQGISPAQVTAMDRLALVSGRGLGALTFEPVYPLEHNTDGLSVKSIGKSAEAVFNGATDEVIPDLLRVGSSGGARPKAQLFFPTDDFSECSTVYQPGYSSWLVKFTSVQLPLRHEEGLCEAAALHLADMAGLQAAQGQLLPVRLRTGQRYWLALRRFDWVDPVSSEGSPGRLHMHSVCGLIDADFRLPSLDYLDLIKLSRRLCASAAVGQLQFGRAMFNLLFCNHDDHSKNWAFLQDDAGQWRPAPFFDVTFSPHPFGEHATAFAGHGKCPPLKTIETLAEHAGFAQWSDARETLQRVAQAVASSNDVLRDWGVSGPTRRAMQARLDQSWQENRSLFS